MKRKPRAAPGALAPLALAAMLAAAAAPPAAAASRYWTFIGGCGSFDWVGSTGSLNSEGKLSCWSGTSGGPSGAATPTANDDVYILAPAAAQTLLVPLAAPQRPAYTAQAGTLQMFGNASFAAGLAVDHGALLASRAYLGALDTRFLGRVDQSGGVVTLGESLNVLGGDYNLSGGTLTAGQITMRSQLAGARFTQTGGSVLVGVLRLGGDYAQQASFSQLAGTVTSTTLAVGFVPGAAAAQVALSGGTTVWTNAGATSVGGFGQGALTVADGARMTTGNAVVGGALGGSGRVDVQGAGALWAVDGLLNVGLASDGRVVVRDGGNAIAGSAVLDTGGSGVALTVDGAASQFQAKGAFVVGRAAGATVEVKNGATLRSDLATLGDGSGSGKVTLSGGASWLAGTGLVVGSVGVGELDMGAQSTVQVANAAVGAKKGGAGLAKVDGNQAAWKVGTLTVGQDGVGEVMVTSGGLLQSSTATVAGSATGSGVVTLDAARWSNAGLIGIGGGGHGVATLRNGAGLETAQLQLGVAAGGSGELTLDGAGTQAVVSDTLTVGFAGSGSVDVRGHAMLKAAGTWIAGTLDSPGLLTAGVSGTLTVGDNGNASLGPTTLGAGGSGRLVVDGGNAQTQALVLGLALGSSGRVDVGGRGVASKLDVTGALAVGGIGSGTLNVGAGGQLTTTGDARLGAAGGSGQASVGGAGALWDVHSNLRIGVVSTGVLSVGSGGLVLVHGLATTLGQGRLVLDGGELRAATVAVGYPGQLDWRSGTLRVTGSGTTAMDDAALPALMQLTPGRTLRVDGTLAAGPGAMLMLGGGTLAAGMLTLNNGAVFGSGGSYALDMNGVARLHGRGYVAAPITGGNPATLIEAVDGPLTLGLLSRSDGFAYGGQLVVNTGVQALLLDKDWAGLGVRTTLYKGALLASVNGAWVQAGAILQATGDAQVQGRLRNDGLAQALGVASLSFDDDVSGAGGYRGHVVFKAGYAPGDGTADVSFHDGHADFATGSTLTLQIGADGHDHLSAIDTLDFEGSLRLAFAPGWRPAQPTRIDLLDFRALTGSLAPQHVAVVGYDAALVDLSRLGVDGTIGLGVSAVPEPATWALWLGGLAAVGRVARRRAG